MTPEELVEENIAVAKRMAIKYKLLGEEFDDVHSDALLGLWQAATRWDKNNGAPFISYALTRIHGQIVDGRIKRDPRPLGYKGTYREERSLDEPVGDAEQTLVDVIPLPPLANDVDILIDRLFYEERISAINKALVILDPRKQHIVKELLRGRTGRSLASDFNITESAISHQVKISAQTIREELIRTGFLKEFDSNE